MVLVEVSEEDFERGRQLLSEEVLPLWAARVDQEWVDLWNESIGAVAQDEWVGYRLAGEALGTLPAHGSLTEAEGVKPATRVIPVPSATPSLPDHCWLQPRRAPFRSGPHRSRCTSTSRCPGGP
jgi:hypothetical protein